MKHELKDMTFLIPVRLDTLIRLENLILSLQYLQRHFITNIIVLEAAVYNNGLIKKYFNKKVDYLFIEDKDSVFYRTKYLNIMTERATTPYVAIWDADVIVPKEQILDSMNKLRDGCDIVYPYDGHFYDTSESIRELYFHSKNIQVLKNNQSKMDLPYGSQMVGGAILINKESYIRSGKENEKFYGWGPEDGERFNRWKVLGLTTHFCFGSLFHLSHPRGSNSSFRSVRQCQYTQNELLLTQLSSKKDLTKHLNV